MALINTSSPTDYIAKTMHTQNAKFVGFNGQVIHPSVAANTSRMIVALFSLRDIDKGLFEVEKPSDALPELVKETINKRNAGLIERVKLVGSEVVISLLEYTEEVEKQLNQEIEDHQKQIKQLRKKLKKISAAKELGNRELDYIPLAELFTGPKEIEVAEEIYRNGLKFNED